MSININALDDRDSPLWTHGDGAAQAYAYTPFGSTPPRSGNSTLPGFNGERIDPVSLTYHLGNGYRAYTPALMRFNTPDAWSPYGAGGLNPYIYCEGDPINRADPSGHLSGQAWAGIAFGILGLLGAVFSAGMSIAAAGGIVSAVSAASVVDLVTSAAGVAADVTSIACGASSESDPKMSQVLGWMASALGAVGAVLGLGHAGKSIYSKFTGKLGTIELADDIDNLADDHGASPTVSEPNTPVDELGRPVVQVDDASFSITPNTSGRQTRKAVVISHGRFQPLQRYLSGTADIGIPDGLKIEHYTRHGGTISRTNVINSLYELFRGGNPARAKSYVGRATFKNYTIRPDHRFNNMSLSSSDFDIVRPVGVAHTQDIFNGVSRGLLPYDEIHFFSCRAIRLTAAGSF